MVRSTMEIYSGGKKIVSGTIFIIDDILLWCSNIAALFMYLENICTVLRKYRVSFWLNKYEFLKPRVEYVGHHLTKVVNCPAISTSSMINNWPLPNRGEDSFSFIGLINFYHRYAPYVEIRLKPLHKLLKRFYGKTTLISLSIGTHYFILRIKGQGLIQKNLHL